MKAKFWASFAIAILVGICLSHLALEAQQQAPSTQAQLAQTLADLSDCQSKASDGSRLKAELVAGNLVQWSTVKKVVESTNPTLMFDEKTHKVTIKPPDPAPATSEGGK